MEKSTRGVIWALLAVSGITIASTVPGVFGEWSGIAVVSMPASPSPEFLRGIAEFGGALVLAYVVQAAWMVRQAGPDEDHEFWVGFMTGTGIAGFVSVMLALLLADHRAAGHDNLLDRFGYIWAGTALVMLATIVTLHPLVAYRLERDDSDD